MCLIVCGGAYSQNVKLKFHNLTGYTIDSVGISSNFFILQKDSVTPFISVKSINYMDGLPYTYYGKETIKELGERIQLTPDCMPKIETITKGIFEFDYKLRIEKKGYYMLFLIPHSKNNLGNN